MVIVTRRAAIVGACGCGLLVGCSTARPGFDGGLPSTQATVGPHPVPIGSIPVGGATVVLVQEIYLVVVGRPSESAFAAHTAICTHQGCTVTPGRGLELDCPCHGSRFDAATGQVLGAPRTDRCDRGRSP